jgi:hypothetical protein
VDNGDLEAEFGPALRAEEQRLFKARAALRKRRAAAQRAVNDFDRQLAEIAERLELIDRSKCLLES